MIQGFIERDVVSKVSTSAHANRTIGANTEAWVWNYLRACLATSFGYDGAREVVQRVQVVMEDERLDRDLAGEIRIYAGRIKDARLRNVSRRVSFPRQSRR